MPARPLLVALSLVAAMACGSRRPEQPSVLPAPPPQRQAFDPYVDRDIAGLFGEPPAAGHLPGETTWSPDSGAVAFIRIPRRPGGDKAPELWIYEIKGGRERPIFADPAKPVSKFAWCGGDRLVVLAAADVYLVDLAGYKRPLTEQGDAGPAVAASPDCARVVYARKNNLFAVDIKTGETKAVTQGGTEKQSFGDVTWLYGEEFDTKAGLGWSPDGKRLWFFATDSTAVASETLVADSRGDTTTQLYPHPGEPNPHVKVGVVDFTVSPERTVYLDTDADPDSYLPRVAWHPDSARLLVTRLDRLQTELELLVCTAASGSCTTIVDERDPRWVNLLGEPVFLAGGKELLWLSERDGFAHIFRIDMEGRLVARLTEGEWVTSSIDAIDEAGKVVYFTANVGDPTSYGLYRVPLEGGDIERLSTERGCHSALFSPDRKLYLDTHSSLDRLPRTDVRTTEGLAVATIAALDLGDYRNPAVANEIFPIRAADGTEIQALITRPAALEIDRRYPALVLVYAGPGAQIVRDSFGSFQPWRELLAMRGVVVFSVDGRGTSGRGHEFESVIHRQLTKVELEDQLAGVEYLKSLPFIDGARLGVFGWSYGGTMAILALLETENVFRVGVAVAPVTDWRLYDTAYTERYMQRPEDNAEGYAEASLLVRAGKLKAPLLIAHGLADDNVHVTHSAALIDALTAAGRDFDWLFYPGKDHGIRGAETRVHLFTHITRFIEEHL